MVVSGVTYSLYVWKDVRIMRKEIASATPKDLKGYQTHRHIFKILLWKGNFKSNLRTKVLLSSDGVDNIEFSDYLRGGLEKQQENDEDIVCFIMTWHCCLRSLRHVRHNIIYWGVHSFETQQSLWVYPPYTSGIM